MADTAAQIHWRNYLNLGAYVLNTFITFASNLSAFGPSNTVLSSRYQTILTPKGTAFSIWGFIFMFEGIFVVAQMFPRFRASKVVTTVTPWWVAACVFQILWTPLFAQEVLTVACIAIFGLLASLVGLLVSVDFMEEVPAVEEASLLIGFGIHAGWILCASMLNVNVILVDKRWSVGDQLGSAMVCLAIIFAGAALAAMALRRPNFLVPLVVAWASFFINAELKEAKILRDSTRELYVPFTTTDIEAVAYAARVLSIIALVVALAGVSIRVFNFYRTHNFPKVQEPEDAEAPGAVIRNITE